MQIVVLNCYARSGGTLINKCLGALPNTYVLSEVSFYGTGGGDIRAGSIKSQMKNWYGVTINSNNFFEQLVEVIDFCQKNDINLVIRDWVFVYFNSNEKNNYSPSNNLEIQSFLAENQISFKSFAFVRDAIDVWISRGQKDIDKFSQEYGRYISRLLEKQIPLFKYEDFCLAPESEMKKISKAMSLPYSPNFVTKFINTKANGDTQLGQLSRGQRGSNIKKFNRKFIALKKIKILKGNNEIRSINESLGYGTEYFHSGFTIWSYLMSLPLHDVFWKVVVILKNRVSK